MSQFVQFNKYILIEKQSIIFLTISNNGLNYGGQFFDNNGEFKDWETIILEFDLENEFYFSWMQLIDSIPVFWKRNIMNDKGNSINVFLTATS